MQSPGDVEKGNVVHSSITYPPSAAQVSSSHHPEPATRLPIEFRTISIHVETRVSETEGKDEERHKRAVKELTALDWHKISTEEALTRLAVSPKTGLDKPQAQRRLQQHGKNVITPPKSSLLRKMLRWVFGGFGTLLLFASIICFIAWKPLGEPPQAANLALAVVLLIVILIQTIFNAWQDFSTSRVMASIKGMLPSDVLVLRDGGQTKVAAKELVPGDLVTISMGEKVPADLKLIEVSADLQFDRSILTGESEAVYGRVVMTNENFLETKNVALQGTHCVSGSGVGLVIQTGDRTVFGVIAKLSSAEQTRMTTLQREILRFVMIIGASAITVAILIVILWAAWLRRSFPGTIDVPTLLVVIVSVMVAFIPDGLPIAVTLSLAKVANILSKKLILCKSLSIVETLGSVNVLCSDKTGTLTQNSMHVENIAILDVVYDSGSFSSTISNAEPARASNLAQVAAIGAICNAASFDNSRPAGKSDDKAVSGNATGDSTLAPYIDSLLRWVDAAILRFSDSVASAETTHQQWTNIYRANFNSKTKFMLQLSELSPGVSLHGPVIAPLASWDNYTPGSFLLSVKGAPEVLMPRCSHVLDPSGGPPIPISSSIRESITNVQENWSRSGQRVLLLARRIVKDKWLEKETDRNSKEFAEVVEEYNRDLIIVGLVGLIDPLKPDIKHTVSVCRDAGIRFFIVTGDYPTTALSIAGQAGIITDVAGVHRVEDLENEREIKPFDADNHIKGWKSILITGPQLMTLSPTQVERLCQYEEIVFARTTPEQKLRIVHEFKTRGNVVAVTGDGVNDAPSLKAADCGVAMGAGSDVAKEAADLVLLGEFSSIIVAIEYGRLVYDNLKKTCLYLLPAGSFSELMPILLNVIIGVPQILSSIQMMIICVATDMFPALSLCLEEPEHGLLLRKPRNVKTDRLVDWRLLLQAYGFLGIIETLCACSLSFWYLQSKGVPFSSLVLGYGDWPLLTDDLLQEAQSVYFFALVLMQWGNLFATRCRRLSIFQHPPTRNIYVFFAPIVALGIAVFFSYIPWLQKVFGTHGIPAKFFFIPLTFGLGLVILDELRKGIVRTYPKSVLARIAW